MLPCQIEMHFTWEFGVHLSPALKADSSIPQAFEEVVERAHL